MNTPIPIDKPVSWLRKTFEFKPLDISEEVVLRARRPRRRKRPVHKPLEKSESDPNRGLSHNYRTFTAVGQSIFKGEPRVWFSSDPDNHGIRLTKLGHREVNYTMLDTPMTKVQALQHLTKNPNPMFDPFAVEERLLKLVASLEKDSD